MCVHPFRRQSQFAFGRQGRFFVVIVLIHLNGDDLGYGSLSISNKDLFTLDDLIQVAAEVRFQVGDADALHNMTIIVIFPG